MTRASVLDLRLVGPALAAWGSAVVALGPATTLGTSPVQVGAVGSLGMLGAGVLLAWRTSLARRTQPRRPPRGVRRRPGGGAPWRWVDAAILAVVAASVVLCSVALHAHARGSGLLPDLVRQGATVELTGTVTAQAAAVVAEPAASPAAGPGPGSAAVVDAGPRYRVVVQVEAVSGRGMTGEGAAPVLVIVPGDVSTAPVYGSTVEVRGRLVAGEPGERVVALLIASRPPEVTRPADGANAVTNALRGALVTASGDLAADQRGLVPAIAVGDTSQVPQSLAEAMRTTGLTHVMAVSGAHFAIIGACVLGGLSMIGGPRLLRAAVLVPVMTGFVLLVHPGASVMRAAGMGAVAVLGLLLGRPSRAIPALGTAVVVLVVIDPWLARDYGFVLSVLATAGLVLLTGPLARRFERVLPKAVAYALAVPTAAQVVCAPVIVLLTPAVSLVAVPANLLAEPAVAPATVLGVLSALVSPWWPPAGMALAHLAGVACWWIAVVARRAADLPGASAAWLPGAGGALLLAVLSVVGLWLVLRVRPDDAGEAPDRRPRRPDSAVARWRRTGVAGRSGDPGHASDRGRRERIAALVAVAAVTVLAVVTALTVVDAGWWPGSRSAIATGWRIASCDVGQGDGTVVRTGEHSAVVLDVGPTGGGIDRCLRRLQIDRIELLVLTHFHADHVGALREAIDGRKVDRAMVSPRADPEANATWALALLADADVPVVEGRAGGENGAGTAGDVHWQVLWPRGTGTTGTSGPTGADGATGTTGTTGATSADAGESGPNDASVVLRLDAPEISVVDLGDLETDAQAELARSLRRSGTAIPADVVKVAHHGSAKQSPALAELLDAKIALVSVGAHNTFGHPTATALDLYRGGGATVLRTDECGDVVLSVRAGRIMLDASCPSHVAG